MKDPTAVIIDVRNAYESAIGHFAPPKGGAQLVDPQMRNSHEFGKWLNLPETQNQLQGKKVMMYCTGGIRCERATALLDQIERTNPEFQTQGIVHCRGGIERYLKTFPEGGHWKGKNFLFDRRGAQVPKANPEASLTREKTDAKTGWGERACVSECCVCAAPWDIYA